MRHALTSGNAWEKAMEDASERKIVETAREARAGFLDRPVLVVLCVSTATIVAVFAVLWLGFAGGT
jgi:hypothetical protein